MKKYPKQGFCLPTKEEDADMVYCEDCEMECKYNPKKVKITAQDLYDMEVADEMD